MRHCGRNVLTAFVFDHLSVTESLPLLIILAGVIGGIVIIIACTMVIILCNRRSKKAEGNVIVIRLICSSGRLPREPIKL